MRRRELSAVLLFFVAHLTTFLSLLRFKLTSTLCPAALHAFDAKDGNALANAGHDTRAILDGSGTARSSTHVRYNELSSTRLVDLALTGADRGCGRHCSAAGSI